MKHDMKLENTGNHPCRFMRRHLMIAVTLFSVATLLASAGCGPAREPLIPEVAAVLETAPSPEEAEIPEQQAEEVRLAARINGEALTYDALKRQFDLYFVLTGDTGYKQQVSLDAFLQRYLLEVLLFQEARKENIQPTPEQIEGDVADYLRETGLTGEELEGNLKGVGLDMADARRFFEKNRIIDEWSRRKFADITVSDEEVRAYYDDNPDYFHIPESVNASQILICYEGAPSCESGLTKEAARETAQHLRNMATPDNFADLAEAYSMDATASKGGRLGDIFKGYSPSVFEKAAFSLEEGEISGVVETDSGYHLILVTERREASDTPFEAVREMIRENFLTSRIQTALLGYVMELKAAAQIELFDLEDGDGAAFAGVSGSEESSLSESPFPTFRETGLETCTVGVGKPLIILFSSASCSHCRWVGEVFDVVVREYMEQGLIEAHHYDMESGDDLLTEAVETEVPEDHFSIGEAGDPDGYLPYFNFGCRYDRIGTGYEEQDDLAAEAEEMSRVIEALLP